MRLNQSEHEDLQALAAMSSFSDRVNEDTAEMNYTANNEAVQTEEPRDAYSRRT